MPLDLIQIQCAEKASMFFDLGRQLMLKVQGNQAVFVTTQGAYTDRSREILDMQLILDRGKGEDVIVTHDQNTITFRATNNKFKSLNQIDLTQLNEFGVISNVIDLVSYVVLVINSKSIWIQKSNWEMIDEPGDKGELIGLFDHGNSIVKVTEGSIEILDGNLQVL